MKNNMDVNGKALIGLSGGINSMAVVCWLAEQKVKPKEIHLYYAHFVEHSDDTLQFVLDGVEFAKKHFEKVVYVQTDNSILEFFREIKAILHPSRSLCSYRLKIEPINRYAEINEIEVDLVGYVKHELKRRGNKQQKNLPQYNLFHNLEKLYPIGEFTDEWCFDIVDKYIGWHPAIYDIKDENGNRVFKHNNCLPCKNMYPHEMEAVKKYYPEKHFKAMELSAKLTRHWGRSKADFYTQFGRDLGQDSTCEACKF